MAWLGSKRGNHRWEHVRNPILSCALLALPGTTWAQDGSANPPLDVPAEPNPDAIATPLAASKQPGVQWKPLFKDSFRFLLLENAFRYATEQGTRDPDLPYFRGYLDAVGNLHGWADGDPFYVNYVGHPMQGAVAGYIWTLNDPKYRYAHFGKDPEYWKSRLRAGAFSWAYGEWTEIGPLISEAAIGNIQALFPQQGFVDHVVTPAIGLGWMIAEDAMDQYLVRFVERRTQNRVLRAMVRGGANPSRSLANVLSGQWPWARPRDEGGTIISQAKVDKRRELERKPGLAPFEFAADAYAFAGHTGSCAGGGGTAAFRVSPEWQIVMDINGCKMNALDRNLTGDSLTYMAGIRWTPSNSSRLIPYFQVLGGGNKLTQELAFPQQEAFFNNLAKSTGSAPPDHSQYTQQFEHNGFAMAAGSGLDVHLNQALSLRLIGLEYLRSWAVGLPGFASPKGLQVKAGIVVRMGTW
jgi:hypothetical protein